MRSLLIPLFCMSDLTYLTRETPCVFKIGFRQIIVCKKATYTVYSLAIEIYTDTSQISLTHLIFLLTQ